MSKQSPDCPLCPAPPTQQQQHVYEWTYAINGDPPAQPPRCAFTAAGRYACQSGSGGRAVLTPPVMPPTPPVKPIPSMASIAATNVSTVAEMSVPKAGCLF
jgi:hypothetical protein